MIPKHPFLFALSLLLALWIGYSNPLTLENAQISYRDKKPPQNISLPYNNRTISDYFLVQARLDYQPLLNSGVLRIISQQCVETITINGKALTELDAIPLKIRCFPGTFTLDVTPYLTAGNNLLALSISSTQLQDSIHIKPYRSTAACLLILVLFAFAFFSWRGWPPLPSRQWFTQHYTQLAIMTLLLAAGILGKLYYLDFLSSDFFYFIDYWLNYIQRYGLDTVYKYKFSDYAPLYTYLLGINDVVFPAWPGLYAVKILSFVGEVVAGYFAYRIVALLHGPRSFLALLAPILIFASPSAIANSASNAQCDIWYTSFLLATVYALLVKRPIRALFYYGVAFSLKMQALFLAPFLLACVFLRMIPWRHLWIVPVIYIATLLPAWLEGRNFLDMLLIYWRQFHTWPGLGHAGNFYYLFKEQDPIVIRNIGLVIAIIAACIFSYANTKRWECEKGVISTMLVATFCVALMPFLLPKMLDRYFFPADIFSLVLACLRPRWFFITVCFQFASLLVYLHPNFPSFEWEILAGWEHQIASVINMAMLSVLFTLCYKHAWKRPGATQ